MGVPYLSNRGFILGGGEGNYITADVIAEEFDATSSYSIGDFVMYDNKLYKCIVTHSSGAWDSTHFNLTDVVSEMGTNGDYLESDVVTEEFDSSKSYEIDDYVMYDNKLYKCITAHTGAWNASDFEISTILECMKSGGGYGIQIIDEPEAEDIADSISTIWD